MAGSISSNDEGGHAPGAWWALTLVSALYVLSFIDRVILALLVAPLKADLGVSDVQLGLLFGPAFALFYALVGLPLAIFADRWNRRFIIASGVLLWGVATIGSALAPNYETLVALRIGLAIGEATLTPSVYSLIFDLFAPRSRRTAASLYSACGMAGASAAYIVGAMVVSAVMKPGGDPHGWRLVFVMVGAPTILLGLLFVATVREPPRGKRAVPPPDEPVAARLASPVRRWPLYLALFCASGLATAPGYAAAAWVPEFIRRRFDWPIQHAGLLFGLVGLCAASGGTLLAPRVTQLLERRGRRDAVVLVCFAFVAIGALFAAAAPFAPNPVLFVLSAGMGNLLLTGAGNNVLVSLQVVTPPGRIAVLTACVLMATSLIGLGLGPLITALVSVRFADPRVGLGAGLTAIALLAAVPAAVIFAAARRAFLRVALA